MNSQADPPQARRSAEATPESGQAGALLPDTLLTIDVLDEQSGVAEVELFDPATGQGRSFELPAAWLPGAAEGRAYRVAVHAGGVKFIPVVGGARALREKSKQTLLEFSDEHDPEADDSDGQGQP